MNKIIEAEELKIELKETQQALYEALNRIDKAIEYIKENFTNADGTIWHEDIKVIYEKLGGKNE